MTFTYLPNTLPQPISLSTRQLQKRAGLKAVRTDVWLVRHRNHLTQAELANRVGVSRKAISHIETGKNLPTLFVALKIADVLHRPLDEIFRLNKPY
jgi:putative transcriptional regulator